MKKLIPFIFVLGLLSSCNYMQEDYSHWYYISDDSKVPKEVHSYTGIHEWVYCKSNMNWKSNLKNDWALPQTVLDRGYGNCVELSLLVLALVKKRCSYKGQLDFGSLNNDGISWNHTEAKLHGRIISYGKDKYVSWKTVDFDNIVYEIETNNLIK